VKDDARRVALRALRRIDEGAFANLVLPPLIERSDLEQRDRDFVTELTYGTTRMRRACDWLVDKHVDRDLDVDVRNALRLGAYQLRFLSTPPHAAVSATVDVAPRRARGFVNAVLRKVAADTTPAWPNVATELSYPDWIVNRLAADLGPQLARDALIAMNRAPSVTKRADGYVQDEASQWVAAVVDAAPGDLVVDTCAGPGGKATAIGADRVIALDLQPHRAGLVVENARRHKHPEVRVAIADGRSLPLAAASADRVLVDAPCSGLGVLGRRADARWRIKAADVERLAALQRELLTAAIAVLRPGGVLVYSVCTLTAAETSSIDDWLGNAHPQLVASQVGGPWEAHGRGARLLPQTRATDGMYVLRLHAP
jgi:16S rRNA (cytosine967-C5)-methyltransferase